MKSESGWCGRRSKVLVGRGEEMALDMAWRITRLSSLG